MHADPIAVSESMLCASESWHAGLHKLLYPGRMDIIYRKSSNEITEQSESTSKVGVQAKRIRRIIVRLHQKASRPP